MVKMLTARVRAIDPEAAGFVHWGATSQDVADTALVLLLRQASAAFSQADHERILAALRALSERHAATVMLGRTLLQPAPPVTFGLKAAGWCAAVRRGWDRVSSRFDEALCLQFGGASGTLAALENRGLAVSEALASELALRASRRPVARISGSSRRADGRTLHLYGDAGKDRARCCAAHAVRSRRGRRTGRRWARRFVQHAA